MLKTNSVSMKVPAGEFLFRHHAPVSSVIHLKQGLVKAYIENHDSRNLILNIHKSGSIFGVQSVLTNNLHNYSGQTIEDSIVCFINPMFFLKSLQTEAKFGFEILKIVSQENLDFNKKLLIQMKSLLPGKVAHALLYLSDEIYETSSFDFPFTISEFAQLIGASRERIGKIMNEFRQDRLIDFENKILTINSHDLLAEVSRRG